MPAKKNTRKPTRKPTAARAKARPAAKTAKRKSGAPSEPKAHVRRQEPQSLRLRRAAPSLTVNDVHKSLAWYRDVLGFTPKERWQHNGNLVGVEMVAGDVTFYITQDDWQKGRHRTKGVGFRIYCTSVQEIDGLAGQIKARGGQLLDEPHDEEWGGRAFAVIDPDGFKITIASE